MNKMFLVTRGLPASGKSTWCDRMKSIFGDDVQVVSSDAVRLEINGLEYDENGVPHISQKNGKKIWSIVDDRIKSYLKDDTTKVIILDATNIDCHRISKRFDDICSFMSDYDGEIYFNVVFFDKPVGRCVLDNRSRELYKQVPNRVIFSMHENMQREKTVFYDVFHDEWSSPWLSEKEIKMFCEEGIVVDA